MKRLFTNFDNGQIRVNVLQAIPFWVASLLTGLVAVVYSNLFGYAENLLHTTLAWHKWMIFIMAPVNLLIGWFIVQQFCKYAGGSGIPQVMAAIDVSSYKNGALLPRLLGLRVIVIKVISSLFVLLGGGAIGREGPTVQIAGSIFRLVNGVVPKSWPKLSNKSFILTGAAAGLAAAFNTHLGGIVFAIEELAKVHMSFFRTALFTAVIIAGLTAQSILGPYLYLGYPDVKNFTNIIFVGVIASSAIAALAGGLMCKAILKIGDWKRTLNTTKMILFILISGTIIACISYFLNVEVLGSGKELMNNLLFNKNKEISPDTALLRVLGPILSFNTGGAGGIFAPSLAAGASIGALLSGILNVVGANANILILSGMVGFLTGVTRTPFTSAILVLEMTDRHSIIFHLMLAALVANIVAIAIEKESLYEHLKKTYVRDIRNADVTQHPQ